MNPTRAVFLWILMLTIENPLLADDIHLLKDERLWEVVASEGVSIRLEFQPAAEATRLGIHFDFTGGAGYGGARLKLPLELPENFDFPLVVRGGGPANNLELKLIDPSGLNVWWVNRRAFELPAEPQGLSNPRRKFQFAWGPDSAPLQRIGSLELILAANEGGEGTVWIEDFRLRALPKPVPYTGTPVVSVSSSSGRGTSPDKLLDPSGGLWLADENDKNPSLNIDFGAARELGGLVLVRPEGHAADFVVEASADGKAWSEVYSARGVSDLPSELLLPDLVASQLRISFQRRAGGPVPALTRLEFLEPEVGASPNAFFKWRAARGSKGYFPKTSTWQQSFWTVVGQHNDDREVLFNEEAMIELGRRGPSVEPFVSANGKFLTWADATHVQSLQDGWAPIPTVVRRHDGLELSITALASGDPGASTLHACYKVKNTSDRPTRGSLILAVRPWQVLPPWQDLNLTGGFAEVRTVRIDKDSMEVNGSHRLFPSEGFLAGAVTFDGGELVEHLARGDRPGDRDVVCPRRSGAGWLEWPFDLAPGAEAAYLFSMPLHAESNMSDVPRNLQEFMALVEHETSEWSARVNRIELTLPEAGRQFLDTVRATQAYVLINHDGRGFQPGSRTYERSWIRDGSMTSAAMLELGHTQLVKDFFDWYAGFQFPSGKVPCVVDRRGADPVPENDSHGQFIWLAANLHRHTGDTELIRRHFGRIRLAMDYMRNLRRERQTPEFGPGAAPRQEPGKSPVPAEAFRGLLPESISHEGYSAKPMHSFWDQFYALLGMKEAAYLAKAVGDEQLAESWAGEASEFREALRRSVQLAQQAHGIAYLPGCVELGDFDSTSSTILLWPVGEAGAFPRESVNATFDRYWDEFVRRRESSSWEAYTPYELRHVGALLRLGQRDRALEVLKWYFADQRPEGWRHWAEVVWRDRSTPKMIGDMPHTWCGSDFLNSARAMLAIESEPEQRLVLLGGVPAEWLTGSPGLGFRNLGTGYGRVGVQVRASENGTLTLRVEGDAAPPGGFRLLIPRELAAKDAKVNGADAVLRDGNWIEFPTLPAVVEVTR
jgi:hypothetical protein